jgi:hypothetical protein
MANLGFPMSMQAVTSSPTGTATSLLSSSSYTDTLVSGKQQKRRIAKAIKNHPMIKKHH